jgi:opacity protein-like surface antigen
MKRILCVGALLAMTSVAPAAAQQVMIEINPFGGLYLPTTDVIEFDSVILDLPSEEMATAKQKTAAAFGGRITIWLQQAFAIEGGFAYALSDGDVELNGQDLCDTSFDGDAIVCDANVWFGSLKGLYRFAPQAGANWAIHLGAGPAVISRGGDAFEDADGKTDIGGVLNVGASFDLTPQVAIRLDAEDYLYSAKFEDSESGVELGDSKFQNDLLFTGGIAIRLGR